MQKLTLLAPAKLNLTLDITGLAPNGYHTLDMVMQTVSLCDTVTLTPSQSELTVVCPPGLPTDERNLALKAAMRLCEHARREQWAVIQLEKNIPAQAGLGGGSADAAAALKGLNELWGLGLPAEELQKIGAGIGSDVPFLLAGGAARVRGVGDIIERAKPQTSLWFLIAKPRGGVGTAEAYRKFDDVGAGKRPDNDRFIEAFAAGDLEGMAGFGGNALEKAAVELLPQVGELLMKMKNTGAGYHAMTGSGAAVFGVFESEREAQRAREKLGNPYWSAVAHPV